MTAPTPLRSPRLSDRARRMLGRIEFAGEITPALERDYIVKGWLDRGACSVLYGDANAGKSFLALDLAHHVHEGLAWAGHRVRPGPVLYIAAEGGAPFDNRLAARRARFMVLRGRVALGGGRNSDAEPIAEAVLHLADTHGPFALIVVDTLARVMAGDENAAPDVSDLLRDVDKLREATGAHVLLVHHIGKDAARGARGHSSLRAAIDTEIRLERDDSGTRTATITKMRDGETGLEARFRLEVVTLGRDGDGDAVTTCIVRHEQRRTPPMI